MKWKQQTLKFRFHTLALLTVAGKLCSAIAQESAQHAPAPQVVVNGSQTDAQARRDFVAGKIIIGRQRIEESGVRTVENLLKREPAVTISGDGRIGLLNMPGYTQMLVDGQQPLAGQAPHQLDLVHVEKIEIVKSGMAEFGPYGIAGTINIVTRKPARKTDTQFATGATSMAGKPNVDVAISHNQSNTGSPLRFGIRLSAANTTTPNERHLRQTLALRDGPEQAQAQSVISGEKRSSSVTVSSNVTWQAEADETITLSPELYKSNGPADMHETRRWGDGTTLDAHQNTRMPLEMAALPIKWVFRPSKLSQVEISGRTHLSRLDTHLQRVDVISLHEPVMRNTEQHRQGRSNRAEFVYKTKIEGGHDMKMGGSILRVKQDFDYSYRINGAPDPALASLGTKRESLSTQWRVYVQDEWRISDSWAFNAGVSGSKTTLDIDEGSTSGQTRFSVWSPSIHLSKKIGEGDDKQLRFSLARSFKLPQDDDFTLRPVINALAPCLAGGLCGANTIDTADQSGNLGLRPERSLGLNISYEHGLGDDSHVTLELFTRRIEGKTGTEITLDSVPWSTLPRYVARPTNLGDADASGVDVALELAVPNLVEDAPKVTLRAGLGLARSHVKSLPGPDNRLDKQTPWTAKLGGSYTLPDFPLGIDVDASWSPSVWVRTSDAERISVSRLFDLDASANWSINKEQRLIFSVRTSSPDPARHSSELSTRDELTRIHTDTKKYTSFGIRFETKL